MTRITARTTNGALSKTVQHCLSARTMPAHARASMAVALILTWLDEQQQATA